MSDQLPESSPEIAFRELGQRDYAPTLHAMRDFTLQRGGLQKVGFVSGEGAPTEAPAPAP